MFLKYVSNKKIFATVNIQPIKRKTYANLMVQRFYLAYNEVKQLDYKKYYRDARQSWYN
jgi:hypothetical protein